MKIGLDKYSAIVIALSKMNFDIPVIWHIVQMVVPNFLRHYVHECFFLALMCNEKDWFFKDGYCYFLSPTSGALAKKTWFEARRFCQENNADLASILSDDLNTFLVEYVRFFWNLYFDYLSFV